MDIAEIARTAVREPTSMTDMKPNELAALIPSRPGVVLDHKTLKSYLLMHDYAQEQGLKDRNTRVFRVNIVRLEREAGIHANDRDKLKTAMRQLVSATVEWNTPRVTKDDKVIVWEAAAMLSHVRFFYDKGHMLVMEWAYADPLLEKLKLTGAWFKMQLRSIRETRTYQGMALYLYLSRWRTFPGQRTDAKHWREWVPILTGKRAEDYDKEAEDKKKLGKDPENVGNSWRYFHRDIVRKAVAEVNSIQSDYRCRAEFTKVGNKVSQLWFVLPPVVKREPEILESDEPSDKSIVARLVELDWKQHDALRLLVSHDRADILKAIEYVERRLRSGTSHKIINKRAYFRTILAKCVAGEIQTEQEATEAKRPDAQPEVAHTRDHFDRMLREKFGAWATQDIETRLAKGASDEDAAALLQRFVTEALPSMHERTQRAWESRGLESELVKADVVRWLVSQVHPTPQTSNELLEACLQRGLVPNLG